MFKRCKQYISRKTGRLPLNVILTLPFVLQTLVAVGLTGWLSLNHGQRSVERLVKQLSYQTTQQIQNQVLKYLETPHQINQFFASAIASNAINPANRQALQTWFWQHIQHTNPGTTLAHGNTNGDFIGIHQTLESNFLLLQHSQTPAPQSTVSQLDKNGQPTRLLKSIVKPNMSPPPWYETAQQQQGPSWSPIFQAKAVSHLIMTATHPLPGPNGEITDILGVTIVLEQLTQFLQALPIGNSGQAFIMEPSGDLVATSNARPLLLSNGKQQQRIQATESKNPLIQQATEQLLKEFQDFNTIHQSVTSNLSFNGQDHLITVTPLTDKRGLNWLIVVMIPESDFTAEIQANARKTVLLCLLALGISLLLGSIVSRHISRIVNQFTMAASQVAQGEFTAELQHNNIAELDTLATAFNRMTLQLQQSFGDLHALNDVLFESESRSTQFLEALPIGVTVHQRDGSIVYLNQSAKTLLGIELLSDTSTNSLSHHHPIYRAGTDIVYPIAALPSLRALQGEDLSIEDLEIRHPNHRILLRARAKPIFDREGEISYAIVVLEDITEKKQAEQLLVDHNRMLTAQVAQKTKFLRQTETIQRAILQGIPDLLIRIRADGQYLTFLSGGEIKLWLGGQESEDMNIFQCLPPKLATQRMHYVRQALATGDCQFYEYEIEVAGTLLREEARIVKIAHDEALVIIRDITEQTRAKQVQEASLALLEATLESTAEGLLSQTYGGEILAYNQKFLHMWHMPETLLAKKSSPEERLDFLANQTRNPDNFKVRMQYLCKQMPEEEALELIELQDGRTLERYTQPQRIGGKIVGRIWTYRDVTAKQQAAAALETANRKLEQLANLDGLTKIPNRRHFDNYLTHEWQRLAREQRPLSLILLDIDCFKSYNDYYGHQAGDNCLVQVAQAACQTIQRPADLVARYGGEEFAVILPNTDITGAIAIAQRLAMAIQQLEISHSPSKISHILTASLGITSQVPTTETQLEQLIWQADIALYKAKDQGRNCYCTYEEACVEADNALEG